MSATVAATPILAISGPSGVGKTTLLVKLIPALLARGIRVAALKHSGHPHTFDRPRKDSARLRRAGAIAVVVQGPVELAYFGPPVRGLRALARLLPPADLILAEGFKTEAIPRLAGAALRRASRTRTRSRLRHARLRGTRRRAQIERAPMGRWPGLPVPTVAMRPTRGKRAPPRSPS